MLSCKLMRRAARCPAAGVNHSLPLSSAAARARPISDYNRTTSITARRRACHLAAAVGSASSSSSTTAGAPTATTAPASGGGRAVAVVRRFYDAYNARDLGAIDALIADDISYHDLVYEEPHEGRQGVMAWLAKVRRYAPDDLKFVVDDAAGDDHAAGVKWHVECGDGVEFPFSRGCSFVRLNAEGRIVSVRDVVEPAAKPGDSTLRLLGVLTPLIRKLGPAANAANLQPALASAAVWGLYALYLSVVMLSDLPPGPPAYATPQPVLMEAFDESVNIFWINEALRALHLSPISVTPHNPVSEGVFNFAIAWALMFVPAILTDPATQKVGNKPAWATAVCFTTNIAFIPLLALRAAPEPPNAPARRPQPGGSQRVGAWGRATGAIGLALCALSAGWALAGRPELGGDLAQRLGYLQATLATDRVFWAFFLDFALFAVWQAVLLEAAPAWQRFTPVVGLGAWLLGGGGGGNGGNSDSSSSSGVKADV